MKRHTIIIGICMFAIVITMQTASADICMLRGFVSYNDGEPVDDNTSIVVEYPYFEHEHQTWTGNDWPYPNFYWLAFTCRQQIDSVNMRILGEEQSLFLDSGVIEHNFTLSFNKNPAEEPPQEEKKEDKDDADKGGGSSEGSSGGSSSGGPPMIGLKNEDVNVSAGNEIVLILDGDWLDFSKFILTVEDVSENDIKLRLKPGNEEFSLKLGQGKMVDLNADGRKDIIMTLNNITGEFAYISIERIPRMKDQSPEEIMPSQAEDDDPNLKRPNNAVLFRSLRFRDFLAQNSGWINFMLIIIIGILIVTLVVENKKNKKKKQHGKKK